MCKLKVGDIVARKSYGMDIMFKVVAIQTDGKENVVTLKGICYRIQADAPESDLIVQSEQKVREHRSQVECNVCTKCRSIKASMGKPARKKFSFRGTAKENKFEKPGRVLHIDGDKDYLESCLVQYHEFGIEAKGKYVPEREQASAVYRLLQQYRPDILVLTGHDGVIKGESSYMNISNYRNTKHFINAVTEARRYQPDSDSLVIFAGACQSMYSEIIKAGANFASAPKRVLIHALDPVLVCQKIAFTGIGRIVSPADVVKNTITGEEGIGGIQTRGKYREGFPLEPAY